MNRNGRMLGSLLVLVVGLALTNPTGASTIDTIGDTSMSNSPSWPYYWTAKGNALRIDVDRILIEQEFFLEFIGPMTVNFCVYEASLEFGTYQRIQGNSIELTGIGQDWYSSGPISVSLEAGKHYITAFSFPDTLTYFYDQRAPDEEIPVSFGAHVHGYGNGHHPLMDQDTIESVIDDHAVYHQRLTTIPEPATLLLLGLGGLAMFRRRH